VQARGALREELAVSLRTGRARRRPHGRTDPGGYIKDMVVISDRPARSKIAQCRATGKAT
jgi:transposase, IS30 family